MTTALTSSRAVPAARPSALCWWLLLAFVAAVPFSIAVSQALLALVLLGWIVAHARARTCPAAPSFFLPLAVYAGATLVSAAFSTKPIDSFVDSRQLLLFLIVPAVYDLARGPRATTVVDVVLAAGAVGAAYGIVQYGMLHYDHLGQRPRGTLSHYMTYAGILMLVLCAAVARLVFAARDRLWPALLMPALAVALALTFTRSAWVGACVATALLVALKDYRLVAAVPVAVAVLFALAPDHLTDRMVSTFDLRDPTNRDRLAMMRAGTAMIADHPLTGVGPEQVGAHYERYRDPMAVEPTPVHLHNVPLQIAAERGVPALAAFVWFLAALGSGLVRLFRTGSDRTLPAMATAVVLAMLTAGLFEYNFGDSEFLMLFLVLVTLPFAAARAETDAAAPDRA